MMMASSLSSSSSLSPPSPYSSSFLPCYLRALGLEETRCECSFPHSVYFVFRLWDPVEAQKRFRDCWPILDKKQEAEFRKKVYEWYKGVQVQNPDQLPSITPSLFLSPGGPKFQDFLSSFLRFVSLHKLEKEGILLETSIPPTRFQIQLLRSLILENKTLTKEFHSQRILLSHKAQEFVDQELVTRYRQKKELDSNILQNKDTEEEEDLETVRKERIRLEEMAIEMGEKQDQILSSLSNHLDETLQRLLKWDSKPLRLNSLEQESLSVSHFLNQEWQRVEERTFPITLFPSPDIVFERSQCVSKIWIRLQKTLTTLRDSVLPLIRSKNETWKEKNLEISTSKRERRIHSLQNGILLPPSPGVSIGKNRRSEEKNHQPLSLRIPSGLSPKETKSKSSCCNNGSTTTTTTFSPILSSSRMNLISSSPPARRPPSSILSTTCDSSHTSPLVSDVIARYRNLKSSTMSIEKQPLTTTTTTQDKRSLLYESFESPSLKVNKTPQLSKYTLLSPEVLQSPSLITFKSTLSSPLVLKKEDDDDDETESGQKIKTRLNDLINTLTMSSEESSIAELPELPNFDL